MKLFHQSFMSSAASPRSACSLEALERRALLSADLGGGVLSSYAGVAPASDLLAEMSAPATHSVISTGDMLRARPYRGGERLSLVAPPAPAKLSALAAGATRADLSWSDSSGNERGFHIYRSSDGRMFQLIATVRARSTDFSDLTAQPGTTYQYKVAAFNEYGFTMSSAASVSMPEAPVDTADQVAEPPARPAQARPA